MDEDDRAMDELLALVRADVAVSGARTVGEARAVAAASLVSLASTAEVTVERALDTPNAIEATLYAPCLRLPGL